MQVLPVRGVLVSTVIAAALLVGLGVSCARAEDLSNLDKGHRLLVQNGLQVIGLVNTGDVFHEQTYKNANYTSILWWANSDPSLAPDMPWVRSVFNQADMPDLTPSEGGAYLNQMVAISLGDEQNLNDRLGGGVFDRNVNWFHAAQSNPVYNNTILYVNSWGSQLSDQNLSDFVATAKPDMISFDTYPWIVNAPPAGGSPQDWYTWTRRYRVYANAYGIPFALYRQTYHSDSEGRRDPSPSEQNLNTNAALAFGSTYLADFTYNTGASSMFDRYEPAHGAGDSLPNAIYTRQATINQQARNLGKALVRLKQVDDQPAGASFPPNGIYSTDQPGHTTSMMFIQGKHLDASSNVVFNDLPGGFVRDPNAAATTAGTGYSDWVTKVNDPYLNGGFTFNGPATYGVKNLGTKNNSLPGDVIISWFKVLDESFDGNTFNDERYFMVVNGLTGPDGTAADYRQEILLDFLFPAATGINSLQRLDENSGLVVNVPLTSLGSNKWRLTLDLDGGMGALFKFNDGAPFVGVTPEPSGALALIAVTALIAQRRRRRGGV